MWCEVEIGVCQLVRGSDAARVRDPPKYDSTCYYDAYMSVGIDFLEFLRRELYTWIAAADRRIV